ncbi:MAG: AbrB/MazE/SpoVT family DNA-binding domain-containing protein [Candidatus Binatia bacterium]|jgi:AbrB family looped-hinge helix DNA binding protein
MKTATQLTKSGQVVIPRALRQRLGWRSGMRIRVEELPGGAVRLRPDDDGIIAQVCGILTEGDALSALEAEHRAEVEADARGRRRH